MFARISRLLPLIAAAAVVALGAVAPASAAAASIHWNKAQRLEPSRNGGLTAVSCPSVHLCVAVDASGYAVTTVTPTGGAHSWARSVKIDPRAILTGVACPSVTLCIAVDAGGNAVYSTDPTGGAKHWSHPARIDPTGAAGGGYAGLTGIACPSVNLCVAVDGASAGNVVTSINPGGGPTAWKLTAVGGILTSVSCLSTTLCVAAGTQHYESTDPTGGADAWHGTGAQAGSGILSAIACPSLALCVGVGYGNTSTGLSTTSTDPKGDATAWKTVAVEAAPPAPSTGLFDAVGCAGTSLCIEIDTTDKAWISSAADGGVWTGGSLIRPKASTNNNAVSCTTTFCVVVDSSGVETTAIKH